MANQILKISQYDRTPNRYYRLCLSLPTREKPQCQNPEILWDISATVR